jgi:hypothetical protein
MLTLCKSMILGAAFLAGVAIAANADPASTSAAGTVANPASGSQSQGRGLAALPPSTATPAPNNVALPETQRLPLPKLFTGAILASKPAGYLANVGRKGVRRSMKERASGRTEIF